MDSEGQFPVNSPPRKEWILEIDNELRIEVASGNEAKITITDGHAEIFGTELVRNKQYTFRSKSKIAIYTWHGCTVEVLGELEVGYISAETPMIIYLNVHMALEQMRQKVEKQQSGLKIGPKVVICGPVNVGKSTLSRILLNYGVRMGRRPIFVDLDVGQGSIAVPGSMGALLVERPADAEEGFSLQTPLVYNFGHTTPSDNIKLHDALVSQLADVVFKHFEHNPKAAVSGFIINTCGWVTGGGFKILMNVVKSFKVDVVLVIDHERVYNDFKTNLGDTVQCVHLPKSGGVFERSQSQRSHARDERIREYFYGGRTPLYPHVFDVKFDEIKVYMIGAPDVPDSCLPLGMEQEDNSMKAVPLSINTDLLHSLCAVSTASSQDEDFAKSNVAGFIVITNVDVESKTLTVLSPAPRPLPKEYIIKTGIKFMDLK
ncbi:protein CLP1 homolog isoform X2 [Hydra vulgaris]|uniref:Protein CLP1 homolog n=1 Tax=Hydra vulgaris TaxID=6087 RepID=A0ABM4CY60_HYDVU